MRLVTRVGVSWSPNEQAGAQKMGRVCLFEGQTRPFHARFALPQSLPSDSGRAGTRVHLAYLWRPLRSGIGVTCLTALPSCTAHTDLSLRILRPRKTRPFAARVSTARPPGRC
jgi:hypothetical protein